MKYSIYITLSNDHKFNFEKKLMTLKLYYKLYILVRYLFIFNYYFTYIKK